MTLRRTDQAAIRATALMDPTHRFTNLGICQRGCCEAAWQYRREPHELSLHWYRIAPVSHALPPALA
jgi:hypothetical protein